MLCCFICSILSSPPMHHLSGNIICITPHRAHLCHPYPRVLSPHMPLKQLGRSPSTHFRRARTLGAWERGLGASCWQFDCVYPTWEFLSMKEHGTHLGKGARAAPLRRAGAKHQMKTICLALPACVSTGYKEQQMRNIKFPSFVPHNGTKQVGEQWFSGPL